MDGNKWQMFKKTIRPKIDKINFKDDAYEPFFPGINSNYEIELFVSYDICNFTRYKSENQNWLELLIKFIHLGTNATSEFSPLIWKFGGDALVFRKQIRSIFEICCIVKQSDKMLKWLQEQLNMDNHTTRIYIKAAIWISGFAKEKTRADNNVKFGKSVFGQEFVGENIDEGFRLCSCSKADVLTVDPKIVFILNLINDLIKKDDKNNDEELSNNVNNKLKSLSTEELNTLSEELTEVGKSLYFMEFKNCKGVWKERPYPIFWYVKNIQEKEFIYDEMVNNKNLFDHDIYVLSKTKDKELKSTIEENFSIKKNDLYSIYKQVENYDCIKSLLDHLQLMPKDSSPDEQIHDSANLYYMIATVLMENDKDVGVLIFKRKKNRVHLKNVWDFTPVKHSRNGVDNYIKQQLFTKLNIVGTSLIDLFSLPIDNIRKTIKPLSLCNIYRNRCVHNGILCVAELRVPTNSNKEKIIDHIKNCLQQNQEEKDGYSDVKLVTYNDVVSLIPEYNDSNIFKVDDIIIRSLTPEEVSFDSNNVGINEKNLTEFSVKYKETDFGISYLGQSIKEILEKRESCE